MTKKNTRRGFTLIELLVVVLIISILAAVAVPQYKLAVNKSRFANLRTTAQSLITAMQTYHLANGSWPSDFDSLPIDILSNATPTQPVFHATCKTNEEIYCCFSYGLQGAWSPSVDCGRKDESFIFNQKFEYKSPKTIGGSYCVAKETDTDAVKLCKSFTGNTGPWANALTPTGIKNSGYKWFELN